ncbi:amidohydrolase family protein [Bacteroidota bacterium]
MVDAHAHLVPRLVDIDELISFTEKAGISQVVLFASASELQNAGSKYPERVIPFLSPFKRNPTTKKVTIPSDAPQTVETQLKSGFFKGIGEITLRLHPLPQVAPAGDNNPADSPAMLAIYDLAAQYGILINVHVDNEYSEELARALEHNREATIIWSHCGYASPTLLRGMLDNHPNLYGDLSIILDPSKRMHSPDAINADGSIAPEWKELLNDYSERLMFGTDMGMNRGRYKRTAEVTNHYRSLLSQLSPEAASNIAYKNILRILKLPGD